jgi:phosphoribosylaminoimidazolecarboxamide formyltransferase/IMP cyclohydrolase
LAAFPQTLTNTYEKVTQLRYGENPHQEAAFYKEFFSGSTGLADAVQISGKELSYNNINDADAAIALVRELGILTVAAVKHGNACAAAVGPSMFRAWQKAYEGDPVSIFGGIVAVNGVVDAEIAADMSKVFLEVIIAEDYTDEALATLMKKKNLRLLKLKGLGTPAGKSVRLTSVTGALLAQETNDTLFNDSDIEIVTKCKPTSRELYDLKFAFKVVKHLRSNAIAIAKDGRTLGLGIGQVRRVWAAKQAIEHAEEIFGANEMIGASMASDAFFPFPDCVEEARKAGIKAIIQPGGSTNDQLSIDKCDEYGIAMVFVGKRHFRH